MSYQIHQLKVSFANFINYSYIIVDSATQKAALVDPAWDYFKIDSIITRYHLQLTSILLTHSHFDHVNLVRPFVHQYNAQVFMSAKEIDYYKFRCPNLNQLQNSEIIQIGETSVVGLETPGHTAGGMCLLLSASLFSGDTIFIEGCGICRTVGGDPQKMYNSLQFIKKNVDRDTKIYPGHSFGKKPGFSLESIIKENIYFQIESVEQFVAFRMRSRQSNPFAFK